METLTLLTDRLGRRYPAKRSYIGLDNPSEDNAMIVFKVEGMTCGHCAAAITRAVQEVSPGATVVADPASGQVRVEAQADPKQVADAIEDAGYKVLRTVPQASA